MNHEDKCPCWECSAYPDNPPSIEEDCKNCEYDRCSCAHWAFEYLFPEV